MPMNTEAQKFFDQGVEHYRTGSFAEAEDALKQGLDLEATAWQMRFYLAMALTRQDKTRQAKQEFMAIRDFCPDNELRKRATAAISAITIATSH